MFIHFNSMESTGVTENNDFISNYQNLYHKSHKIYEKIMEFSLCFTLCHIIWLVLRLRLLGLEVETYQRYFYAVFNLCSLCQNIKYHNEKKALNPPVKIGGHLGNLFVEYPCHQIKM